MLRANGWTNFYEDTTFHDDETGDHGYWSDEGPVINVQQRERKKPIPHPKYDDGNYTGANDDSDTEESEVKEVAGDPSKAPRRKSTVSVAEAWALKYYSKRRQNVHDQEHKWVHGDLDCFCVLSKSKHMLMNIPDVEYMTRFEEKALWYDHSFIFTYCQMLQHNHHPPDVTVAHMMFNAMNVTEAELFVFAAKEEVKTLYSVVWKDHHYVVMQVDFESKRVMVYDGQGGNWINGMRLYSSYSSTVVLWG